jgi:two-component system phosphate regulon sensor histidine kinase PhoR
MNQMGRDLQEQIETIGRQGNERDAIITSMAEAVIALDREGHIVEVNPAAVNMLHLDTREVHGRLVHEVLRHADPLDFIERLLAEPRAVTEEFSISGDPDRHFIAHGNTLRDVTDRIMGVVIVLSDITRLRQLETIRREFVANVSHELRTPVTVIKGAAETLLDGALDDPEAGHRFALAIQRQSNRLAAVIADTLSLSEIERDAQQGGTPRQSCHIAEVLAEAVEQCQTLANQKSIRLESDIEPGMTIDAHRDLLRRAVVNLIDNAVRYSEANTAIQVAARRQDGEIVISVLDQGCGIAPRHMPRLFERFFRVDPARSRELGGTGLGLAIVKHVALLHGGRVDVESQLGDGSRFSVILPSGIDSS